MIKEKIRLFVEGGLRKIAGHDGTSVPEFVIERPADGKFGHFSANAAFMLAKELKRPPQEVARELAGELDKAKPAEIARVEAVGGYVNFFLSHDFLRSELERIYKRCDDYGRSEDGRGRKIIVEYSQPNIAKKMHIGHLRTTVLGDALANIYEALGYKVIRWNYLGDWGTQFGKLIAAYKMWGSPEEMKASPISTLLALYVRFHKELKEHPELDLRGQEEFLKLEKGDKENKKIWKWFRELSLEEFEGIYKTLGIKFDVWMGESSFEKDLGGLVDGLLKKGVAETGEGGAIIIKIDRDNMPPALIRKSDGASLYLTRDIAALSYRLKKYKPEKALYVVGNEQALHFEQLFAVARIMGMGSSDLAHVKYGLVLGEDKRKMATREGEAIPLEEVLEKAVKLAREIVEQKNSDLSEKEKTNIASAVAIGALKYEMLKEHRNSDIVFSWSRMLDFAGNSAPYLQYTYARLASILDKAGKIGRADFRGLSEPAELNIISHLLDFPDVIADSARLYLTNNLALYLYELANLANRFYETTPILKDDNLPRRNARLVLIAAVNAVLKNGLELLGINVLDQI